VYDGARAVPDPDTSVHPARSSRAWARRSTRTYRPPSRVCLTGIRPRRRCVFVPRFFCSLYERTQLNSLESSVMSGAGGGAVERHKRHHGKRI
jgi:hypothetical protein